ncbi:MAG: 50S ribosomal protein L25 [Polyangiales bacterium]
METTTLQAEVRTQSGKGPARRLRMEGKLPAVIYGPGLDPVPLTVDPVTVRKTLSGDRGRNSLFTIPVSGADHLAMVKDLVVEPVSRELIHVDFYLVSKDRPVNAEVLITTSGRAVGVVKGGKLKVSRRTLKIRCTPDKIPSVLNIDVSALDLFETLKVKDLDLPEGVACTLNPEHTIVSVLENKRVEVAAEEETAAAEPAAG